MTTDQSIQRVWVAFSHPHSLLSQIEVPAGTALLHASPAATPEVPSNNNYQHQSHRPPRPWEDYDMTDSPPELSYTPTTTTPPELDEGYSYYTDWPYDFGFATRLDSTNSKRKHDDDEPAVYGPYAENGLTHSKRVHITPTGHRLRRPHPVHSNHQQSQFPYQQLQQKQQYQKVESLDAAIKRALGQYGRLDLIISTPAHLQSLSQMLLPYISANTIIEHGALFPAIKPYCDGINSPTGVLLVIDEGEQEEEDWPASRATFCEAARELGCRVQAVSRLGMQF